MNKQTLSNIIIALGIIIVVILGIWLFVYLPNVGSNISSANDDWGYFGEFFWGLGSMLLTGLNVFVLVLLNKQLHENNESQQDRQNQFMIKMEEERRSICRFQQQGCLRRTETQLQPVRHLDLQRGGRRHPHL